MSNVFYAAGLIESDGTIVEADDVGGASSPLMLTANSTGETPLTIEAIAGQTADLAQWHNGSGALGARITDAAELSNPQGQSQSESFGASATLGDTRTIAIGCSAEATKSEATAVGFNCHVTADNATAFGSRASATGSDGVAVGRSADASFQGTCIGSGSAAGPRGVALGLNATADNQAFSLGGATAATAVAAIAIGDIASASARPSIAIGYSAAATAVGEIVIGSDNSDGTYTDIYAGKGKTAAAPGSTTYHATGGSGTDVAGGDIIIAGGTGTGAGAGGSVKLQTAPAGASGSSANALSDGVEVDDDTTAGNTRFLLYDVDSGTLQRVSVGAADSGGSGFKVLRIPN